MSTGPRISIQLVTWNSASTLAACLESLPAQKEQDFELVVIDNASTDGSAAIVEGHIARGLPWRLVRSATNLGFCGGHNRALTLTTGEWVLLLNPDAELPPEFLSHALQCIARLPSEVGSVVPRIVLPDGRLDSTGLTLDRYRRVRDRGQGEASEGKFLAEEDVLGGTGAVILHRRAMLEDVAVGGQVFDENLFAYYDDLDLALRARARGWRCRYIPSLTAIHKRGGRNALRGGLLERKKNRPEQALTVRNRLLVMAKCERREDLLRDLPWLLAFEAARMGYLLWRAPGALRGYVGAAQGLPAALRARRQARLLARKDK